MLKLSSEEDSVMTICELNSLYRDEDQDQVSSDPLVFAAHHDSAFFFPVSAKLIQRLSQLQRRMSYYNQVRIIEASYLWYENF